MKTIVTLLLLAASCLADVIVGWDANAESDLAGYRIHIGTEPGAYTQIIDVGNVTEYNLDELVDGTTYYSAVTAYNTGDLESKYSTEITFRDPPDAPQGYAVKFSVTIQVEP